LNEKIHNKYYFEFNLLQCQSLKYIYIYIYIYRWDGFENNDYIYDKKFDWNEHVLGYDMFIKKMLWYKTTLVALEVKWTLQLIWWKEDLSLSPFPFSAIKHQNIEIQSRITEQATFTPQEIQVNGLWIRLLYSWDFREDSSFTININETCIKSVLKIDTDFDLKFLNEWVYHSSLLVIWWC